MRGFFLKKIKRLKNEWMNDWRNPICKLRYRKTQLPVISEPLVLQKNGYSATHVSAFTYENMGDCVLPVCLRKLFSDQLGMKEWHNGHIHKVIDDWDVRLINCDDFLVIGGGGLFIKTPTKPIKDKLSGWQWSCDIKHVLKIRRPIIMFAVGYNRFRGEEEFAPIFKEYINKFVRKASFVGLRNHGSVEKVRTYLESQELKDKVCYQPCMTTLIAKLYPDFLNFDEKEDFIAINCAYDREEYRVDNHKRYTAIARAVQRLSEYTRIKMYMHKEMDKQILVELDKLKVAYEMVEFCTAEEVVRAYSKPRLVIGMRGHAQMIPFGCHTPILSIISHDKMQWFLNDIHHSDWGVEINDDDFEDKLCIKARDLYDNYKDVICEIKNEQDLLWNITMQNMQQIKNILKTK